VKHWAPSAVSGLARPSAAIFEVFSHWEWTRPRKWQTMD
jgi:hypothetical protein